VDGRAKVTGAAKYAAEYTVQNLTYGYVISSAIAKAQDSGQASSAERRNPHKASFRIRLSLRL